MELPRRARGDELLKPGELLAIRARLRALATQHDLATVIACAFDRRTRMLPFFYTDLRMAPAGVRAIGSAMVDSGFPRTRIVLQQWNPNFSPSRMRLDGQMPDLFMLSGMSLHTAPCREMIRDVCRIDAPHRPLVIAGGSVCVYEPWELFRAGPTDRSAPDVAVTGEEYVLLNLLEVLLSVRGRNEPMRSAFLRAKDEGLLDAIPGLVYPRGSPDGEVEELVDTGIQRLVGDLDELPHPVLGYALLERPSRSAELASKPLPAGEVRKHAPIAAVVLTFGCKFSCSYCPIPAYNQRQLRFKSGPRIVDEMYRLYREYRLRYFFGADDNFFNDKARALDIVESLARAEPGGLKLHRRIRWGTEVTVHDTLAMKDHLATIYKAGVRGLWLGVEDMTGALVRKGQTADRTEEAFRLLRQHGICPMPMMMHHDSQPLLTPGRPQGLLNQVNLLARAGAINLQVLMLTPSAGSKAYRDAFTTGMVFRSAGGRRVEPHMFDGNYVIASFRRQPWRSQLNLMAAYLYFYNPFRLIASLFRWRDPLGLKPAAVQLVGIVGLAHTLFRTVTWALRLITGRIQRQTTFPASEVPMRSPDGGMAAHAAYPLPDPQAPQRIPSRASCGPPRQDRTCHPTV
jgi:radical SAM superfamily enzyme YgiQ (UPF0313 family)